MKEGRYLGLAVICTLTLCIKAAAETPLDMAPDAVDDMYEGCAKDALDKLVLSDMLQEELNKSIDFSTLWNSQSSRCPKLIPGGLKQHTTALRTIAMDDGNFITKLNMDVYAYGTNTTTYDGFYFKSLHFLLMDSIRLLHTPLTHCKTVYSFSSPISKAQKGSTVRLGRFWIGFSSLKEIEEDIDDQDILNITTCFFADLGENICNDMPVTLLSPAEEFTVEDVRDIKGDPSYHMIVLKHSQLKSMHNCYIFSSSPDIAPHWLLLALLTPSFFIIS
ncbi:hypothetical protein NQD34_000896 [Periophthalmus magnuspinnatus]|uniref:GPI-linked NAD(P)(+)--arginine ADP-ribosyltransferase 1 isoform X1 n=2 Tax=Periophthalmus magnuspinnatus TaxID=409849 RepID=UPI0022C5EBC5|nr:GPI-linked NAD(P)(+)--arginine ADP-ribosyltransferase 1 isoform X1 [Periophthalmus magnuspinnatus]KAJ0033789.1 hypothetical protein NQD34_000896 [Periophthalmus magnuspinnatus]